MIYKRWQSGLACCRSIQIWVTGHSTIRASNMYDNILRSKGVRSPVKPNMFVLGEDFLLAQSGGHN